MDNFKCSICYKWYFLSSAIIKEKLLNFKKYLLYSFLLLFGSLLTIHIWSNKTKKKSIRWGEKIRKDSKLTSFSSKGLMIKKLLIFKIKDYISRTTRPFRLVCSYIGKF